MLFPRLYRYVLRSFNRHSTGRGFVQSNSFQSVRRATVLTTNLHAPKDHYSRGETSERILFIMSWSDRQVQNERYDVAGPYHFADDVSLHSRDSAEPADRS
jgi:hypothetical protein